jgi:hypothetical protein
VARFLKTAIELIFGLVIGNLVMQRLMVIAAQLMLSFKLR